MPKAFSRFWHQTFGLQPPGRPSPPGRLTDPVDAFWQSRYFQEPYHVSGRGYDQYRPAYALGWCMARSGEHASQSFEDVEPLMQQRWAMDHGTSLLRWEQVRDAARASWLQARAPAPEQAVSSGLGLDATALLNAIVALGRQAHERLGQCMDPIPQGLIGQVLARHFHASQMLVDDLERAIADHGGVMLPARAQHAALLRSAFWQGLLGRAQEPAHMLQQAEVCQQQWLSACEAAAQARLPQPLGAVLQRQTLTLRGHIEAIHWLRRYML